MLASGWSFPLDKFQDWKTSVEPKIAGALNLHSVLSNTPLDFPIMISSVLGILGTLGQSNYAAANSYLDSLVRHRRVQGEKQTAISLVLPMVLGVGVVAENAELEDALTRKGMYGIDEKYLLEDFEAVVMASSTGVDFGSSDHILDVWIEEFYGIRFQQIFFICFVLLQ